MEKTGGSSSTKNADNGCDFRRSDVRDGQLGQSSYLYSSVALRQLIYIYPILVEILASPSTAPDYDSF